MYLLIDDPFKSLQIFAIIQQFFHLNNSLIHLFKMFSNFLIHLFSFDNSLDYSLFQYS